ncbi:MAG: Transcriptional regulatory protein SrrA [Firmicutes bacterium ADurb.Bin193]|nr:MAG: Transcriptional regulatory protein SrrA [Firmicutes bacterium ADurb.Bin193]
MKKKTILVVDDESRMRKLIRDFLLTKEFDVIEAQNGEQAIDIFTGGQKIDLVILDVMMPGLDGWAVCREIRQISTVPIMMLTARGDERDELLGFELGADEYISKPFSPKVLVARVEALLRRATVYEGKTTEYDGLVLDRAGHSVRVDGKPVNFTVKEFELLEYLIENEGIALSRDKILNNVWAYDYFGDARTVDTHIKKVRSKLGSKGCYIKTVWGMGYKFEVGE